MRSHRSDRLARSGHALVAGLLLVVATTGCEGPQTDPAPTEDKTAPAAPQIDPAVQQAISAGEALFFERAVCFTCHRVGERGTMVVGPNLGVGDDMKEPLADRARARRPELRPTEYVIESMLDPDRVVVPSYAPGVMKSMDDLPIELSNDDLVALAAFVSAHGASSPPTPDDLERAKAYIATAREARASRREAAPPG